VRHVTYPNNDDTLRIYFSIQHKGEERSATYEIARASRNITTREDCSRVANYTRMAIRGGIAKLCDAERGLW